ncbi:MAG: hypothetical protein AUK44_09330 [Porphyromonadaceae bacterium CG2_30_38_12]|nr:MAG: hypothetical protein AUK44_09330 [Porphyromonadaceae bacterium CG2_30_38_12]
MNYLKFRVLIFIFIFSSSLFCQELSTVPERSPEQEALKQTEKLQQELHLTIEQARRVHEINLKYARERQASNSRSDAIRRVKEKESDLTRILNDSQREVLQNKRYERSSFQPAQITNMGIAPTTRTQRSAIPSMQEQKRTEKTRQSIRQDNSIPQNTKPSNSSSIRHSNPTNKPSTSGRR